MFCPNCGKDCGDAKFCSECGQDLRSMPNISVTEVEKINPPVGQYKSAIGYIELKTNSLVIHKKILRRTVEREILYHDITDVFFKRAVGLGLGYLAIREKKNQLAPMPTSLEAASDETTLSFGSDVNHAFYGVYEFLKNFVDMESVKLTAEIPRSTQAKIVTSSTSYKPKSKFDVRNERKRDLDKSGQVYCPKCLSTSISANQKGFGFARGAIGATVGIDVGLIAGGIGSKKVICTCLKCGYQWKPGKR